MRYRNATKTSIYAGGKWIPQRGYVELDKPNNHEKQAIAAGHLVPRKGGKPKPPKDDQSNSAQ